MKPGLVVKLRPSGPWRIGPDSGARNRVDVIYHSDSLYSAVTSAMGRLGLLEEWLQATVREPAPAVCFSSCFPFLNEIGLVVPPRTVWPPKATSLASARVRWKSARFVPLDVVRAILAGEPLNEDEWTVDGPSECLVPSGRPGPFRTGIRWNAAVDRLTGASERHATACIEFRPGAGLWTIAGFRDGEAHTRWLEPVKAAFRLLADTGFGGERSRGWGRSEQPEFIEGSLPDMILPVAEAGGRGPGAGGQRVELPAEAGPSASPSAAEPEPLQAPESLTEPAVTLEAELPLPATPEPEPLAEKASPAEAEPPTAPAATAAEPEPLQAPEPVTDTAVTLEAEPPAESEPLRAPEPLTEPAVTLKAEPPAAPAATAAEPEPLQAPEPLAETAVTLEAEPTASSAPTAAEPEPLQAPEPVTETADTLEAEPPAAPAPTAAESEPLQAPEPLTEPAVTLEAEPLLATTPAPEPLAAEPPAAPAPTAAGPDLLHEPEPLTKAAVTIEAVAPLRLATAPRPEGTRPAPGIQSPAPVWLLSLFTPAPADAVDWGRGNYTVLARGGRIDSPAGSGELKKQVPMVVEGSVLYAAGVPHGAAPDVAPEGFAHPVFRAGFALAIPLPGPEGTPS